MSKSLLAMLVLVAGGLVLALAWAGAGETEPFDVLISDARIVDGTGGPWRRGDVGVRGGKIRRIGRLAGSPAKKTIAAEGRVLAPGFVDVHTHVEMDVLERPEAANLIADGVTTIVTGNCGASAIEIGPWLDRVRAARPAVNVATLIGHNDVRRTVLGGEAREPTRSELSQMESIVAGAMAQGAVGFSSGLIYAPGTFSKPEEVASLAAVAARWGGVYATHMRNENVEVFTAIDEAVAAARASGAALEISHFKVTTPRLWGQSRQMLERVSAARDSGVDVAMDQYPYTASSTGLAALLPDWSLASSPKGKERNIRDRLKSKKTRAKIEAEMVTRIRDVLGRTHLDYAVIASAPHDRTLEGKSLSDVNRMRRPGAAADTLEREVTTAIDLCLEGMRFTNTASCAMSMIYHVMSEEDVERILADPRTTVARDGGIPAYGVGRPHPRSYGTSARVLGHYVREKKVISLEEAVRKMSAAPAERFGFRDRGLVREGFRADLVLFDPATVRDAATFDDPHRYSEGIDLVLVNGVVAREGGKTTGERGGQTLLGPGATPPALRPSSGGTSP
jgi:N-acyl-D-amino-acid deacylase